MRRWCVTGLSILVLAARAGAQLLATDDFEDYTGNPIGQVGGSGNWVGVWAVGSQADGGTFLSPDSKIDGTRSLGLYGQAGMSGESVNRPFAACTNELTVAWSMRADLNVNNAGGAPVGLRRMAVTLRSGNGSSHFDGQRLAFFFAAGTTNFMWYDGVDRTNTVVNFTLGHVYDLRVTMNPTNRAYSFVASNRNNGTAFSYSGSWTLGANGDSIGSLSFLMRGPNVSGNDAFLDSVSVSSPSYVPPPLPGLPIREGDMWRYYKGTSTPAAQGTNQWYHPDYSDIAWLGPSPSGFGYGDSDDATALNDMQNSYVSVYTRRQFLLPDTSTVTHLTLAADYDDGFVAYLNGVEVARRNMPGGAVTNTTVSSTDREASRAGQDNYTCNCDPQEKEFITLDPGALRSGTNTLAVSGHNISLTSSDFSLIVELYTNISLVRGPILQMPNQGRVTVLWRTDAATDGVVEYGFDTNYSAGVVSNAILVRQHELELPALPPGTTVYYRIRSGGLALAESYFRAPKVAGQAFRFALMSDYGSPTTNTTAVAAQALLSDPDLLITSGDNVQQNSGPPGLFDGHWFGPLSGLLRRVPMMPSMGNHDVRVARGQWYLDALVLPTNGPPGLAERNYSYDYANAHFVVLDANAFVPDGDTTYTNPAAQRALIMTWLTNDLHTTTQLWKFVSYHHPPYTSQGTHNDAEVMKANLSPIFEKYGINIAFQGHNHFFERINPINGVNYITVGSGGFSIHGLYTQREFSAKVFRDKYDFVVVDIDGPHLVLRCIDQDGAQQDSFDLDLSHPFNIDGRLDTNALVLASNALNTIKLHGAIRGNYLYVAGQDAPPPANGNNDHFIFVNTNLTGGLVSANWAKAGSNMQWSAFLGDESTYGFISWFGAGQQLLTNPQLYRATSSGLFQNGIHSNGVMEGTLNLPSHFGSFPPEICLAFAPYTTADGGTVLWEYQIPPAGAGDNVNSNEWLRIATRALALDLPVAEAGSNASAEAGMWVGLDGSGSTAPSGLPLSFAWAQDDGPAGQFTNASQAMAQFRLAGNIPAPTSVVVHLLVHDTRFDSNDVAQLSFTPMVDSDGDGLSDQEEQTGLDNAFTLANPGGATSAPNDADSDDDGVNDGFEALAGTDRNDSNSLFQITSASAADINSLLVRWSSVTGRLYTVRSTTNLVEGMASVQSNIPASDPYNTFTVQVDGVQHIFYAVEVQP